MAVRFAAFALAAICAATGASAEFAKVNSASEFKRIVTGKTLSRPLVKLEVSPAGRISGKGMRWPVSGSWTWRNGYFCRDLYWGDDALGYNCQEVRVKDGQIRFTSDRGTGDYADFRLR